MKAMEFNTEKLERGCDLLGISLSTLQTERLRGHLELLAKWNRRLNLTAIKRADDMLVRHLLDSLAIARFAASGTLLDIGSGGGFPGVPLAIANPDLRVTLLDSRARRVEFLRYACAALGLGNVSVVKQRVEDYRPAEKFDTLATRAFASLGDTLQATAALHRPGARLLAMKGQAPLREMAHLDTGWRERVTVERLRVPFLAAERHLIIIEL